MNRDYMAGEWKEFRGKVRERWGKLTDDDLDRMAGKRDQLVGHIQKTYGIAREAVEKQLDELWQAEQAGAK